MKKGGLFKWNWQDWTFIIVVWSIILIIPIMILYRLVSPVPLFQLSEGMMVSKSAKLSYKGIIWKTWDGWIPIGVNDEGGLKQWKFTVTDSNQSTLNCVESGKQVKLYYKDYVWMPFRKGNSHQVDKCEILGDK